MSVQDGTESNEGYVKTAAHNYVSRKSIIHGPRNVEMKGKCVIEEDAIIRGDFASVRIGRYCHVGRKTIIRPPSYLASLGTIGRSSIKEGAGGASSSSGGTTSSVAQLQFLPLLVGNHTHIGSNCIIESASIGSSCSIGNSCVISKRVVIKDCCYIHDETVIPPDTVIPPFSRVSGCPARIFNKEELPESVAVTSVDDRVRDFSDFVRSLKDSNQDSDSGSSNDNS
mmetsp:Transcript_15477/g.18350  ORF Transcript_15477/g.18350 Transcript_15477/m.18350 type:complete len:226 (-) Transcript_15477:411-1088(-)|eukprot:CAMPEP_0198258716 /NCGR_PEP_ID=MMETSP1447-20131203/8057_1 /TAXON_ID=420782 /ORGANISM="Chaetoceros dichaeta, Strain CCMP1751" /LENGTH=225 /DNA_ID=CAMNT_0043945887 /DNA_START=274 /DNA_END=951 /DNA_ORIENTATION=+